MQCRPLSCFYTLVSLLGIFFSGTGCICISVSLIVNRLRCFIKCIFFFKCLGSGINLLSDKGTYRNRNCKNSSNSQHMRSSHSFCSSGKSFFTWDGLN